MLQSHGGKGKIKKYGKKEEKKRKAMELLLKKKRQEFREKIARQKQEKDALFQKSKQIIPVSNKKSILK